MSKGKGLNVQGDSRKYQQPPQAIDISDTETIVCEECGNASFIQSYFLKRVSALVSPTGKEAIASLPVGDTNAETLFKKYDCMKDAFPHSSQTIVSVSLISIACGGCWYFLLSPCTFKPFPLLILSSLLFLWTLP